MQKKYSSFTRNLINYIWLILFFFAADSHSFADVKTAQNNLSLPSGQKLILVSKLDSKCYLEENEDAYCLPSNKLFLITQKDQKKDLSELISKWESFFVFFVKLTPNAYASDLNKDGNYEIAILPNVAGQNVNINAYLYSVSDSGLSLYGVGKFNIEFGPYVTNIKTK